MELDNKYAPKAKVKKASADPEAGLPVEKPEGANRETRRKAAKAERANKNAQRRQRKAFEKKLIAKAQSELARIERSKSNV